MRRENNNKRINKEENKKEKKMKTNQIQKIELPNYNDNNEQYMNSLKKKVFIFFYIEAHQMKEKKIIIMEELLQIQIV